MKCNIQVLVLLFLSLATFSSLVEAQNRYEEYIPFDAGSGKIVVSLSIGGEKFPFALDLQNSRSSTISARLVRILGVTANDGEKVTIEKVGLGEGIFFQQMHFTIVPDPPFTGVEGTIGSEFFMDYVLTIDSKQQELILTAPFKPDFVQVKNRTDLIAATSSFSIEVNGEKIAIQLDLLNSTGLRLIKEDSQKVIGTIVKEQRENIQVIQTEFLTSVEESSQNISTIGSDLLAEGLISLDYKRGKIYLEPYATLQRPERIQQTKEDISLQGGKTINLNVATFLEHVFDFRQEKEWKYKGDKPAVIDLWAEWCGPCKKLSPILEELASTTYKDDVLFFKVNVDDEPEIQRYFKANSLPLLIYIPVDALPIAMPGLRPKEAIIQSIQTHLLK